MTETLVSNNKTRNITRRPRTDEEKQKIRETLRRQRLSQDAYQLLSDPQLLEEFSQGKSQTQIAHHLGVAYSTVNHAVRKYGIQTLTQEKSQYESDVFDFVCDLFGGQVERNNRSLLNGQEIDIYVPEKSLAIEFNGSYWHSELRDKHKSYHVDKTNACQKLGITLLHVSDWEWINKQILVKSKIRTKLGFANRIYARCCTIVELDQYQTSSFLNTNYIQGTINSDVCYGLIHKNNLVAVMTFGESIHNKHIEWELLRYCSIIDHTVVGGASKLLNYFKKQYHPKSIVSYSDKRWDTGNLYEAIGFEYSHTSPPSYRYTRDYRTLESRSKYQKHKLHEKLDNYDPDLTEWQNMINNGYDRIWDCGAATYVFTRM